MRLRYIIQQQAYGFTGLVSLELEKTFSIGGKSKRGIGHGALDGTTYIFTEYIP